MQELINKTVKFNYINYKGNASIRTVFCQRIVYGESPYHNGKKFFLVGIDLDKKLLRSFTIETITELEVLD